MNKGLTTSILLALYCLAFPFLSHAQLTTLPSGGNKKASITERVDITDITLH